jgi:hypothetical protein
MDITLKNTEINKALEEYVAHQGINLAGKHVEVTFTAGRGSNGNTAVISIMNPEDIPKKKCCSRKSKADKSDPVNLSNIDQVELPFTESIVSKNDAAEASTEEPSDDQSLFSNSN